MGIRYKNIVLSPMILKSLLGYVILSISLCACVANNNSVKQAERGTIYNAIKAMPNGLPSMDLNSAVYEVAVNDGVSYQDVLDSLKSISEGMNFVNPANFPIGEHIKLRGVDPQGIKEVHSFCNLSMGTEIILDHPEFLVFAPCRIALYEKPDFNKKLKLFIGLARPTYDLKSIKAPTERAKRSAQELEDALIKLIDKARRGDF
jgi:uncharacterized protein (DUF302 family)